MMLDKVDEVKKEIVNLFRRNQLTVAEIREVLRDINEAIDYVAVIK